MLLQRLPSLAAHAIDSPRPHAVLPPPESILVVKGLGLQLQARFADGREEVARFLDLDRVTAVIINEGFTMHRVVYYLAFLVEGRDELVVAFPVRTSRRWSYRGCLAGVSCLYVSLSKVARTTPRRVSHLSLA